MTLIQVIYETGAWRLESPDTEECSKENPSGPCRSS